MIMVMSGGEWIAMDWEQLLIEWVLNCVIVLLPRKPELRIFSPKGYYSNYYPLAFPFRAGLTVKNGGAEGRIYRGLPVTTLFFCRRHPKMTHNDGCVITNKVRKCCN